MKDSANSYEQRKWVSAAAAHARLKAMLKGFTYAGPIAMAQKRIDELEKEYPQLKK
jgi:hypothetical protein